MSTTNTRKLVYMALLSAISSVLAFPIFQFPLIPAAPFLKVDLTILPILIGLFMMGLSSAFVILIVRSIIWLFINGLGPATVIGLPMNMAVISIFLLIFWAFLKTKFSVKAYLISSILSTLAIAAVMLVLNYVYALPLYSRFANFDVVQVFGKMGGLTFYLFGVVLPFNLIEGVIFSVAFAVLYFALRSSKAIKFLND